MQRIAIAVAKIDLSRVPGAIKAEALEKEHGRWIYSFEIKATGETAATAFDGRADRC